MSIQIQQMKKEHLSDMLLIQERCYTQLEPETGEAFEKKRKLSPSTCFVAIHREQVVGYLVSLPRHIRALPSLNATQLEAIAMPDCLYLHDLAVDPHSNGLGVGAALVQSFFMALKDLSIPSAALIAVQNAEGYWRQYGFQPAEPVGQSIQALQSYGKGCLMVR